jgi:hypothetical protein
MAKFLKVPTFDIYDEETDTWVPSDEWWLEGELVYLSDILDPTGEPYLITVPDNFQTDLASIPKFPPGLRTIFIRNGKHRIAAVPHDYLCRLGKEFPRRIADAIFLEAMKLRGVNKIKRGLMWLAVRANTERLILLRKAV